MEGKNNLWVLLRGAKKSGGERMRFAFIATVLMNICFAGGVLQSWIYLSCVGTALPEPLVPPWRGMNPFSPGEQLQHIPGCER